LTIYATLNKIWIHGIWATQERILMIHQDGVCQVAQTNWKTKNW